MNILNPDCAIYASKFKGPTFGCGIDLAINSDEKSHSNLGESYEAPSFISTQEESELFLANSLDFNIEEIEVYVFENRN